MHKRISANDTVKDKTKGQSKLMGQLFLGWKVTFALKEICHDGKKILGSGNDQCKSPGTGMGSLCSQNKRNGDIFPFHR
jgi:hypothetical protein